MLYVTHSADEVAKLADTVVTLAHGKVTTCGPAAQVMAGVHGPGMAGEDVGALLLGLVVELDEPWSLARAAFKGGSLWLRDAGLAIGRPVRLRVLARDVSIATEPPQHSSIQNVFPCVVQSIHADSHPSQVLVRLHCGDSLLVSRITARAAHTLALQPGQSVWAQVKSVALVE
jgi:molybdate transport system ATP-binding protein